MKHRTQASLVRRQHAGVEAGQSLVLIALMLVAMLGMLGLALDGGRVYASRRTAQNAADAAAFAGVRLVATHYVTITDAMVWNAVMQYAQVNGIITTTDVIPTFINASGGDIRSVSQFNIAVPSNATGVRVRTTLQVEPYFIRLLIGDAPVPIPAVAAAQSGPPAVASRLKPMAVFTSTFNYTQTYQIWGEKSATMTVAGGFQWVGFRDPIDPSLCKATGTDIAAFLNMSVIPQPVLADRIDHYYNASNPLLYNNPPPSPNPWLCSSTGVEEAKPLRDALDCWLFHPSDTGGGCWPAGAPPGNREWQVPVFNHTNEQTGSNAKYHVMTFGVFEFLGYWFKNGQCNFVGNPNPNNCPKSTDNPPLDPGLQPCELKGEKCLMGRFVRTVDNIDILPGMCNLSGLDVCGMGLSQ